MQEITSHVYIDTNYPGVTLGAINWNHGLVLVDAPLRLEDARSWRSAQINMGGGVDRLLVNLDAHLDRTLGARAMDCTVISHEKLVDVFHARPMSFKPQNSETGAEWELHENLGTIRWATPEITFSDELQIHWEDHPICLENHPGCAPGAIWLVLPQQGVVFLGDAVVPDQPPFLANADVSLWIDQLHLLLSSQYRDYLLVSGRGGLIALEHVRSQIKFLEKVEEHLISLAEQKNPMAELEKFSGNLYKGFKVPLGREKQYHDRLKWGLTQYFMRHHQDGFGLPEA